MKNIKSFDEVKKINEQSEKTLRISKQEAQKLAGENYFVGTLEEC